MLIRKEMKDTNKELGKMKRLIYKLVAGDIVNPNGIIDYDNLTHKEVSSLHRQSEIRREMLEELLEGAGKENRQLRIDLAEVTNQRNEYSREKFLIKAEAVGNERIYEKATADLDITKSAIQQLMTFFDYHEATQILEEVRLGKTNVQDIAKLVSDRYMDAISTLERIQQREQKPKRPSLRSLIFGRRKRGGE
jgi:hypothetical protein